MREYALRFFDLIRGDVGTLIVRVQSTPSSNIGTVCAEHSSLQQSWMYRIDVGMRLSEVPALESAPACLANARLDFNLDAARLAIIHELTKECKREAERRFEANSHLGGSSAQNAAWHADRGMQLCVEQHQLRRGEIWFSDEYGPVHSVFLRTDVSSERNSVLTACSEVRPLVNQSASAPLAEFARAGPRLRDCMAKHAWEQEHPAD